MGKKAMKKAKKKAKKKHELGESAVKPGDLPHCIGLLRTCRKQLVVSSAHLDKDPAIKVALDKAMAKPKKHAKPHPKKKPKRVKRKVKKKAKKMAKRRVAGVSG